MRGVLLRRPFPIGNDRGGIESEIHGVIPQEGPQVWLREDMRIPRLDCLEDMLGDTRRPRDIFQIDAAALPFTAQSLEISRHEACKALKLRGGGGRGNY